MKKFLFLLVFSCLGTLGYSQNVTVYNFTNVDLALGAVGAVMDPFNCPVDFDGQSQNVPANSAVTFVFRDPNMTAMVVGASTGFNDGYQVYPNWLPSPFCEPSVPGIFTFTWVSPFEVIVNI